VFPAIAAQGKQVNTVETLGSKDVPHALQTAWLKHQVPQCGYCQSGMMMAASALLKNIPNPSDADIDAAMTNICRCGTYSRVKAAILDAAKEISS
jgi:isoquinoline 1-oxidoreductase alpha subunit